MRPTRYRPDATWAQVVYTGGKSGTFTIQGRSTGLDYTVVPGKRFVVHPNDAERIGALSDFMVLW